MKTQILSINIVLYKVEYKVKRQRTLALASQNDSFEKILDSSAVSSVEEVT